MESLRHQEAVQELRARSVSYMERNWRQYENLILSEAVTLDPAAWPSEEDKEEVIRNRIEKLKKPGTWGGSDIIRAVCDLFRIRINVYIPNREICSFGSVGSVLLNLYYNGLSHYDSISAIEVLEASSSSTRRLNDVLQDRKVTQQPTVVQIA